jgi:hypothetical protein
MSRIARLYRRSQEVKNLRSLLLFPEKKTDIQFALEVISFSYEKLDTSLLAEPP